MKKIKEQDALLKEKEDALKASLTRQGSALKRKASRVGKIALATGIISLLVYWFYSLFRTTESTGNTPSTKPLPAKRNRIWALIAPFFTRFVQEYLDRSLHPKKEQR